MNAFHHAAYHGNTHAIHYMAQNLLDKNVKTDSQAHTSTQKDRIAIMFKKILNKRSNDNHTPLMMAAKGGYVSTQRVLVDQYNYGGNASCLEEMLPAYGSQEEKMEDVLDNDDSYPYYVHKYPKVKGEFRIKWKDLVHI